MRDFDETAALLAYDAPASRAAARPARRKSCAQLPARRAAAKIIPFLQWFPYAIAACLMALGIVQAVQIRRGLKTATPSPRTDDDARCATATP